VTSVRPVSAQNPRASRSTARRGIPGTVDEFIAG